MSVSTIGPTGLVPAGRIMPYSPEDAAWIKSFLVLHRRQTADENLPRRGAGGGLNHEEMAEALGISVTWYGQLERAVVSWNASLAARACDVLRVQPVERAAFYHRVGLPLPSHSGPPTASSIELTEAMPVPAFLWNETGQLLHSNEKLLRWRTPFRPGINLFEWGIGDQSSRGVLRFWERDWRDPMIEELKHTIAFSTADTRAELQEVKAKIVRVCPDIEPALTSRLRERTNGSVRHISRPGDRQGQAYSVWSICPPERPRHRITTFIDSR